MRIVNLIENTEGASGCAYAHGLSFYIETSKHRILMDFGPSEEILHNAEKLAIDLKNVDIAFLSHGHYDHAGGLLAFHRLNPDAVIYMQNTANGAYYADEGENAGTERYRYIGIDPEIMKLPQIRLLDGDLVIDEELSLYTLKTSSQDIPFTNADLLQKVDDRYVRDEFIHEQFLVIHSEGRHILLSGCAHNGITNILDGYQEKYHAVPDAVISGFHLMKRTEYTDDEIAEILSMAGTLKQYPTRFVTCHCTGIPVYNIMKNVMGAQLQYVHSGEELQLTFPEIPKKKKRRRSSYMKWHKAFAWGTVFCFVMTMVTGYRRK